MSERNPGRDQYEPAAPTPSIRWGDGTASAAVLNNGDSIYSHAYTLVPLTAEEAKQHLQDLRHISREPERIAAEQARQEESQRGRLKSEIKIDPNLAPPQGK